jgi:heptosyltransferase-2
VLSALRQQFPGAHLEVLGYPHIAQLALAGGLVDRVQAIEARALAMFFARNGELPEEQRDYFSEFNIIVSYLYDPDEIFRENVARCSPAQFIAAPHRPDEREGIHATQVFLNPLTRLAIFDADPIPRLAVQFAQGTRRTLAMHPGSGSERKNWPEARWAELLTQLARETDVQFLLVAGEAEGGRLQRLAARVPADRCDLALHLPLPELAARLGTCVGFVGHDSGITHLAAALGLSCVVLWGETPEELWRPQGERIILLHDADGLHRLPVATVSDAMRTAFPLG